MRGEELYIVNNKIRTKAFFFAPKRILSPGDRYCECVHNCVLHIKWKKKTKKNLACARASTTFICDAIIIIMTIIIIVITASCCVVVMRIVEKCVKR